MRSALKKPALITRDGDQTATALRLFSPIDTVRIARDFKIEVVARDRGSHNLPATHDDTFDPLEKKIVDKVEEE
jgi:hypothetical protein